jgi:hypothetical protein
VEDSTRKATEPRCLNRTSTTRRGTDTATTDTATVTTVLGMGTGPIAAVPTDTDTVTAATGMGTATNMDQRTGPHRAGTATAVAARETAALSILTVTFTVQRRRRHNTHNSAGRA